MVKNIIFAIFLFTWLKLYKLYFRVISFANVKILHVKRINRLIKKKYNFQALLWIILFCSLFHILVRRLKKKNDWKFNWEHWFCRILCLLTHNSFLSRESNCFSSVFLFLKPLLHIWCPYGNPRYIFCVLEKFPHHYDDCQNYHITYIWINYNYRII